MHHEPPVPAVSAERRSTRRLRLRPPTATPAAMAVLVQTQFLAGAALALTLSLLPGQEARLAAVLQGAALAAVGLAVVVRCRGTVSAGAMHLIQVLAAVIVTAVAAAAADPGTAVAFTFCYTVMIVVAVASCSWHGVALHLGIALAALVLLHTWRGVGSPTTTVLVGFVTALLAIVIARTLRATVDSEIDVLTRLSNRRGLERHLASTLAGADDDARADGRAAADTPLLCIIDVDHFDQINRTSGQGAGDAALHTLAQALRRTAPPGAVTARLGGDQFALLTEGINACEGLELAQRVQQAILPLQVSIGLAQAEPEQDAGVLVRRAETALREAKAAGRNCVRVAEPTDEVLLRHLRSAIANTSVGVALQPLVDPHSQALVGVEALARWHHPSRGWIPPATFIPLAEKNGLAPDLGRVLLDRACRDALLLVDHVGQRVRLTVNASGAELVRPGYAVHVAGVLHRTQWPAGDLVIEVTESSLDAASPATLATIEQLRGLGVGIAIDDFGTGYSAFSQLDSIPAEYLKLDTSFTAAITSSARRRAMLSALVVLCHDLGLRVIAEGVETCEQAQLVAEHGCDLAQGYFYSRPMPVGDLIATLAARGAGTDAPATAVDHAV